MYNILQLLTWAVVFSSSKSDPTQTPRHYRYRAGNGGGTVPTDASFEGWRLLGREGGRWWFLRQHPPQKMLETSPENRHISCIEDKHGCKDMLRFRETHNWFKSRLFRWVCYMLRPFKARFDKHQPFLVMSKGDISQTFSDDQLEGKIVVSSQALTRGDIHHSSKIRTYTPKLWHDTENDCLVQLIF